jgi:hypothetical protein
VRRAIVLGDFDPHGLAVDPELAAAEMECVGVVDGGEALWEFTFDLLAPYETLITSLAAELWRAGSLDGGEIDAVMFGLAQYPSRQYRRPSRAAGSAAARRSPRGAMRH